MNQYYENDSIVQQGSASQQKFMNLVYGWMSVGLLLTAFVAWYTAQSPAMRDFVFSGNLAFYGLIAAQLGLVIAISAFINRLSSGVATTLFMLYSVLTGITLSSIFLVYTTGSIVSTFFVAAGMFAALSVYGYSTSRDLSGFGRFLFMGLIGIVLASLVNLFFKNDTVTWVVTYIGVFVFAGLTAYDTQKLKMMGQQIPQDNAELVKKFSIVGALTLYLDFINLFLMLLRILGSRDN